MKKGLFLALVVAVAGSVTGCNKAPEPAVPGNTNNAGANVISGPVRAQPRLPMMKIFVGPHEMQAELATQSKQHETGMMFREKMEENESMLFVFEQAHRAAFYMRNTTLPLSAAYIDSEGIILEIHDLKPLDETSIQAESAQVQYVLETKQGWFERHQITVGASVATEKGSLKSTFFRRQ